MTLKCLENIVGITKDDCPCILSGLTTEQKTKLAESTSGLYTDNLEGGIHLKALKDLDGCNNLAELALNSRDEAIQRTSDDIAIAINQNFAKGKKSYLGYIGSEAWHSPHVFNSRYGALRLKARSLGDTVIKIKKVKLGWTEAGQSVHLILHKVPIGGGSGAKVWEEHVTTVANGFVTVEDINETFPFTENGIGYEYFLSYDVTGLTGRPVNNNVSCNCGTAERILNEYLEVSGAELSEINPINVVTSNAMAHGLIIEAEVKCEAANFICREFNANDRVGITSAYAVLYKTGELLIEAVIQSPEINRFTMMHREYLWGKRNHFRKEYEERIMYIGSVVDIADTDCYICKDDRIMKRGILS